MNIKRKGGNIDPSEKSSEPHKKIKLDLSNFGQQVKDAVAENNLKKIVKLSQGQDFYKEYKKLKFKNTIYLIQDDICVSSAENTQVDFVGKLNKIIRIDHEQVFTIIEVQWYYRKTDIPKQKGTDLEVISENEVFLTEHTDYIFVDTINGKSQILSYAEYDCLQSVPNNTYFMRAKFDTVKKKFIPPMEKWNLGCICNKPLNPDLHYIMCEGCELWLHLDCVGLQQEDVDTIENYTCPKCKEKKQQ